MNVFTACFMAYWRRALSSRVLLPLKLSAIEPDWSSTSTMSHGSIEVVVVTLPVVNASMRIL